MSTVFNGLFLAFFVLLMLMTENKTANHLILNGDL